MSPASYLTAPPRDAASILPSTQMTFVALAFLLVAVLGSAAVATVRGIRLWRALRDTSERAGDALERLSAAGAATETRAMGLQANSERLPPPPPPPPEAPPAFPPAPAPPPPPRAPLPPPRGGAPPPG